MPSSEPLRSEISLSGAAVGLEESEGQIFGAAPIMPKVVRPEEVALESPPEAGAGSTVVSAESERPGEVASQNPSVDLTVPPPPALAEPATTLAVGEETAQPSAPTDLKPVEIPPAQVVDLSDRIFIGTAQEVAEQLETPPARLPEPVGALQLTVSEDHPGDTLAEWATAESGEEGQDVNHPHAEISSGEAPVPAEEELPPAFKAWFELFGEEPPELLSKREEKLVREVLGAPAKSSEDVVWQQVDEVPRSKDSPELVTTIEELPEPTGWVSSAALPWAGEVVETSLGEPTAALETAPGESEPEEQPVYPGEHPRKRRRAGRHRPKRRDGRDIAASVETTTADHEQAESEEDLEDQPGLIPPDAVPTWEETVGLIIAANMENRARSQHSHGIHPRRPPRN
ncbi:MAG: hypothetical protein RMJ16_02035 [Thermoguttaceae bacterium]|nr:hypothetical protein [Thermoguttaceae bacterium]